MGVGENFDDPEQTKVHFKLKLLGNGILLIAFDYADKQANVLDEESLFQFGKIVQHIKETATIKGAVLVSLKRDIFIAGADIAKIHKAQKNINSYCELENLITGTCDVLYDIENSKKPYIVAIEGACMGGGLEIALACHARILSNHPKTKLALPEVNLGILPGFGGTFRLPRLVGLWEAIKIIVFGKAVYPFTALKTGLADAVLECSVIQESKNLDSIVNEAYVKHAVQKALCMIEHGAIQRKLSPLNRLFMKFGFRHAMCWFAKYKVKKFSKNFYPAPLKALEVIKSSLTESHHYAMWREKRTFRFLSGSGVSCRLMSIHLATEKMKRKVNIKNINIGNTIGIIGAGDMGSLMAAVFSENGCDVILKDVDPRMLGKAAKTIAKTENELLRKRIIKQSEYDRRLLRVCPTLNIEDLTRAEIVIEAVVEKLSVKQAVLAEFENVASENTVFATNTSSFTLAQIAENAKQKNRIVGMHFFNPPTKMKLVEIVRGKETSDTTMQKVFALARQLDKIPVLVNDGPGFLVNRVLARYLAEAVILVCEGNAISRIDAIAKNFGMAVDSGHSMGPLELIDYIKAPIAFEVLKSLKTLGMRIESAYADCAGLIEKLMPNGAQPVTFWRKRKENAEVYRLVKQCGYKKRKSSDDEILKRLMYPMVDEARRCLAENIAQDEETIDIATIYGIGFPAFRGGLMTWAHKDGPYISDTLSYFSTIYGKRFEPIK